MTEKKANEEVGVEGEDYIVLTPEKNASTIIPWSTRVINDTGRPLHIAFRHTNLMTKVLYISDAEEKRAKSEEVKETSSWKEKIRNKIGKEI
jgi:hypothetical protein